MKFSNKKKEQRKAKLRKSVFYPSFTVGEDYIEVEEKLVFQEGEDRRGVTVTLLDDAGRPSVEGREVLHLVLRSPLGGLLGRLPSTTLAIDDTRQDGINSFLLLCYALSLDRGECHARVTILEERRHRPRKATSDARDVAEM